MDFKCVSRFIGIALLFNSAFMLLSAIVSAINGFDASFSPLLISAVMTFCAGIFPLIFVEKYNDISIREGFLIIVLSWILSCLFGMLPYILWGGEFTVLNAWFESVSGFTTSGSTILKSVEILPKGLLFWRSSTHFIGGIGVVIFMLLVLPSMSTFRLKISKMEISSLSKENYKYRTRETIRVIAIVYIGLTILETICLLFAGMSLFDAVTHSFSTIATGGFSTRDRSIMSFDSLAIEIIIMVFMLLGGLHFGLLFATVTTGKPLLFKSPIIRFYLATILIAALAVGLNIRLSGDVQTWGEALRYSFFQVISVITTTGFSSLNSTVWPLFSIIIMMYLSIQCACSGSTTGGLKSDRVWIFIQSLKVQIKKQVNPNAVIPVRVGNSVIEPELISAVNLYIILYFFIIIISTAIYSISGISLMDSLSASISGMGNVGHGFGQIGNQSNFSLFPEFGKAVLTLQMLLGRLEIYPVLLLFVIFKKR